ncbi:MAG: hypothetical protein M3T56_05900 [Chloroflexota bacterium]|nr:hypothetical protein [Chloroflexota bacterium]
MAGHLRPVIDDGLDALPLDRERGGRGHNLEAVALDQQVGLLGLVDLLRIVTHLVELGEPLQLLIDHFPPIAPRRLALLAGIARDGRLHGFGQAVGNRHGA